MKDLEYDSDFSPLRGSPIIVPRPILRELSEQEQNKLLDEHKKIMEDVEKLCKEIEEFLGKP